MKNIRKLMISAMLGILFSGNIHAMETASSGSVFDYTISTVKRSAKITKETLKAIGYSGLQVASVAGEIVLNEKLIQIVDSYAQANPASGVVCKGFTFFCNLMGRIVLPWITSVGIDKVKEAVLPDAENKKLKMLCDIEKILGNSVVDGVRLAQMIPHLRLAPLAYRLACAPFVYYGWICTANFTPLLIDMFKEELRRQQVAARIAGVEASEMEVLGAVRELFV